MKNTRAALILWILQIIYAVFTPFWFIAAIMSIMSIAGIPSEVAWHNMLAWLLFLLNWLFPIGLLVSILLSWIFYHKRRFRAALWFNCIALIWVVPLIILFTYFRLA